MRSPRDKGLRWVAITIILALVLSLLVAALSISPSTPALANSVQFLSSDQEVVDTDGDGVENNTDSDVDGDGIVNGEDADIDGDGLKNFDDADPIDTTDIDSNDPNKPNHPAGVGDNSVQDWGWIWGSLFILMLLVISAWLLAKRREK